MSGNDAYTKVLLHCDGADTSTTITDSNAGGSAHTWTARGNAQIDTGISKFGGAALLLDGTGDFVDTPDHADFDVGSQDFTIDAWFNRAGGDGTFRVIFGGQSDAAGTLTTRTTELYLDDGNKVAAILWVGSTAFGLVGSTTFTATGWHHAALVRNGANLILFVDGVSEASRSDVSGSANNPSGTLSVGRFGSLDTFYWNGSIDEVRLSVGIARWTLGFTPPTLAYDSNPDKRKLLPLVGAGS